LEVVMRKVGLLGVLLIGLLSVTLLQPAQAQDIWCYEIDFTETNGLFIHAGGLNYGTWIDGVGWEGTTAGSGKSVYIGRSFSPAFNMTYIEMDVIFANIGNVYTNISNVHPIDQDNVSSGTYTGSLNTTGTGIIFNPSSGAVQGNQVTLTRAYFEGNGDNPFGEDNVDCDDPPDIDGLTLPLIGYETHPEWGIYDYDHIESLDSAYAGGELVTAYSEVAGASVTAVAPGKVVSVDPFTPEHCLNDVQIGSLFLCAAFVPSVLSETSFNLIYALEMVGNYIVIVEDAEDATILYTYILNSPTVTVGDDVVAGCVLGKTIRIKEMPFPNFEASILGIGLSGGLSFVSQPTQAGVAYVYKYSSGAIAGLYPLLVLQPDLSDCTEQRLQACINANPELNSLDFYEADADITMLEDGDGINIPRFTYIIQRDLIIDPEEDYTLNVQARMRSAGGDDDFVSMNLQLGSQVETFTVTPDWNNYSLTSTGDDWHDGTLTKITVSNQIASAASLEVRYICLAPVTSSTAPGSCYFANHEFDQDGTAWEFDTTTFNFGQAIMRDGDTLTQGVILKPDDESTSHTYTIRAVARLLANSLYTGQVGKEVTLSYQYPVAAMMTELGTIDSALVLAQGLNSVTGAVSIDYAYTLETTIEIEDDTDSAFTFEVAVTDGDNYIQGMRLDSVCIDPAGDGTFPGQDDGGGYIPPFIEGCTVVPVPLEGSVGAWTFYHWSQLKRFFYCDLMKLLNNWFKQFEALRRLIMGVARWWIALVHHGSKWLSTFVWWLNGSFRNIATGQVTTIVDGGGCHDFFCAIVDVISTLANLLTPVVAALNNVVNVLLGILIGTVNLFFTMIGGLVAIAVALIIKLLSFFQLAGSLLTTIIGAYNAATPTAIPGMPMCATDFDSSLLCPMVWATDNTIFAGRWGILFVVLLSIFTIHLILWAIGEFKDVLLKTWGSS
jgi:hypothetical protein